MALKMGNVSCQCSERRCFQSMAAGVNALLNLSSEILALWKHETACQSYKNVPLSLGINGLFEFNIISSILFLSFSCLFQTSRSLPATPRQ
jgi:hypothetical protein